MDTWAADQIVANLPLVHRIAGKVAKSLPRQIERADLEQVGAIGLIRAARRFDTKRGVKFQTYVGWRIHGAMLDALKHEAWPVAQTSVSDKPGPEWPDAICERAQWQARIAAAITFLSWRERQVITRYYYGEVSMKEVAVELGVSETRAWQLHGRALSQLGKRLDERHQVLRAQISTRNSGGDRSQHDHGGV